MTRLDDLFKELDHDINIKDDRGKVIALHLYIEEWVNEILKQFAGTPEIKARLSFWKKVKMVYAVGLIDDLLLHNISCINKLRNLYSHQRKPSKDKIEEIIAEMKERPCYEWGWEATKLEGICVLTMMELDDIYESLKKSRKPV